MTNLPPPPSNKPSSLFGTNSSLLGARPGAAPQRDATSDLPGAPGVGKITQVIGPVVDIEFTGELPEIFTALKVTNGRISDQAATIGAGSLLCIVGLLLAASATKAQISCFVIVIPPRPFRPAYR